MKPLLVILLSLAPPLAAQGFRFDPDYCFTCVDSRQHALGGTSIDVAAQLVHWPAKAWQRVGVVAVIGAVFEVGEEEGTRGTEYAGRAGYGFGVKDLVCDVAGAAIGEGLGLLWRKIT